MHIERFEIAERFRGPPRSGNGGYVCGRIAKHLRGTVATRLKAPPPLGKELRLESSEEQAHLFDGETLIGEAKLAHLGALKADQDCLVSGWPLGNEGRKRLAGSAVYTADGSLVALARAVWIEVPSGTWA